MGFAAKARTRTTPTVKPLVTMNRKNNRSWELKLGLPQAVVLVGVLTGSMACAFGIGYVTGQRVGFENALASSISSLPKYPIAQSGVGELDAEDVREVYAKLQADPFEGEQQPEEEELPELEAIRPADEEPVVDDLVVDLLNEEDAQAPGGSEGDSDDIQIRVLGEDAGTAASASTLGSLVREQPQAKAKSSVESDGESVASESNSSIQKKTTSAEAGNTETTEAPSEMAKIAAVSQPAEDTQPPAPPVRAEQPAAPEPGQPEMSAEPRTNERPFVQQALRSGWYAQVAAPQSLNDADSLATRLEQSGFPVVIEEASVRGQTYYRVLVGPEDNRPQGEILLEQVRRERYLNGQPFIRMVK